MPPVRRVVSAAAAAFRCCQRLAYYRHQSCFAHPMINRRSPQCCFRNLHLSCQPQQLLNPEEPLWMRIAIRLCCGLSMLRFPVVGSLADCDDVAGSYLYSSKNNHIFVQRACSENLKFKFHVQHFVALDVNTF